MKKLKLWIAIPDTLFEDSSNLRDKTVKIGVVARCCSIFGVSRIYIYQDPKGKGETSLMQTLLEYANLPPYLRRLAYGRNPLLSYAGLLPPIKSPHHLPAVQLSEIMIGDFRQGYVVRKQRRVLADVGLKILVPIDENVNPGSIITVQFISQYPNLRGRIIDKRLIDKYWGYEMKIASSLTAALDCAKPDFTVLTSRRGIEVQRIWPEFEKKLSSANSVLLIFGSPGRGVLEILGAGSTNDLSWDHLKLNFVPTQQTETVRSEEAMQVTLAIVNLALHL